MQYQRLFIKEENNNNIFRDAFQQSLRNTRCSERENDVVSEYEGSVESKNHRPNYHDLNIQQERRENESHEAWVSDV